MASQDSKYTPESPLPGQNPLPILLLLRPVRVRVQTACVLVPSRGMCFPVGCSSTVSQSLRAARRVIPSCWYSRAYSRPSQWTQYDGRYTATEHRVSRQARTPPPVPHPHPPQVSSAPRDDSPEHFKTKRRERHTHNTHAESGERQVREAGGRVWYPS